MLHVVVSESIYSFILVNIDGFRGYGSCFKYYVVEITYLIARLYYSHIIEANILSVVNINFCFEIFYRVLYG